MRIYIDRKTKRAYFVAPKSFNTDNIAYWVKFMRDKHDTDTDVYLTKAQYDAIESDDTDAGFFALINAGLYIVD